MRGTGTACARIAAERIELVDDIAESNFGFGSRARSYRFGISDWEQSDKLGISPALDFGEENTSVRFYEYHPHMSLTPNETRCAPRFCLLAARVVDGYTVQ